MNHITVHGNISQEPEIRYSGSGLAVLSFNVADTYGKDDKKKVTFHSVTVFGNLAENVAASIKKGDSVLVSGRLETDEYKKKDGSTGKFTKIIADEVAFSMRWSAVVADKTDDTMKKVAKAFPNSAMFEDEDAF